MVFNCRGLEKLWEVLEPEGEVIPGVLVTVEEDDDADAIVDRCLPSTFLCEDLMPFCKVKSP